VLVRVKRKRVAVSTFLLSAGVYLKTPTKTNVDMWLRTITD